MTPDVSRPASSGGTWEHVTGAYSEHAKTKKYTQRRGAWGGAHRAAGTHQRGHTALCRPTGRGRGRAGREGGAAPEPPVSVRCPRRARCSLQRRPSRLVRGGLLFL
jgi:hypothetical protein